MGFPPQFFTVLFAVPRVTGYLAHWRESLTDPDVKIARPQQIYLVRHRDTLRHVAMRRAPCGLVLSSPPTKGRQCMPWCVRELAELCAAAAYMETYAVTVRAC